MKPRPAYRKRFNPPHPFQWDQEDGEQCCGWTATDGRVCGLPRANRHHDMKPTTQPAEPEDQQLRLDIDG